jgi:hypothetical protein
MFRDFCEKVVRLLNHLLKEEKKMNKKEKAFFNEQLAKYLKDHTADILEANQIRERIYFRIKPSVGTASCGYSKESDAYIISVWTLFSKDECAYERSLEELTGLAFHEVGHALYTYSKAVASVADLIGTFPKNAFHVFNIIEDYYIEGRLHRLEHERLGFNDALTSLREGMTKKHIGIAEDIAEQGHLPDPGLELMNYLFGGVESPLITLYIQGLLNQYMGLDPENFVTKSILAKEITELLFKEFEKEASKREESKGESGDGEGEPGDGESGEGEPSDGEPGEGEPSDGQPSKGEPSDGEPGDGQPSKGEPCESEPSDGQPSKGEPSESEPSDGQPGESAPDSWEKLREALEEKAKELARKEKEREAAKAESPPRNSVTTNIKGVEEGEVDRDFTKAAFEGKILAKNLRDLFDHTEKRRYRSGYSSGGRVNPALLLRGQVEAFSRKSIKADSPDVAIAMRIDCSGSMSQAMYGIGPTKSRMSYAAEAAFTLYTMCEELGIPCGIYLGAMGINAMLPVTHKSSSALAESLLGRIFAHGGNADGEEVLGVMDDLMKYPKSKKLLINISDGEPTDTLYETRLKRYNPEHRLSDAFDICKANKIIPLSLGIVSDPNLRNQLRRICGENFLDCEPADICVQMGAWLKRQIRMG